MEMNQRLKVKGKNEEKEGGRNEFEPDLVWLSNTRKLDVSSFPLIFFLSASLSFFSFPFHLLSFLSVSLSFFPSSHFPVHFNWGNEKVMRQGNVKNEQTWRLGQDHLFLFLIFFPSLPLPLFLSLILSYDSFSSFLPLLHSYIFPFFSLIVHFLIEL